MKWITLIVLGVVLVGCVTRIPAYAPRRTNTEAHRNAVPPGDCLGCHDLAIRNDHQPDDNCLKCHPLCKGC